MSKPPLGLLQKLRTLLAKNDVEKLNALMPGVSYYEVAWCLTRFPLEERVRFFSAIPPEIGARIYEEMDIASKVDLLSLGRLPVLVEMISHLDSNVIADVLGVIDPIEKEKWLATLPTQEQSEAQSLLAYPPDTAGGLMAKEYLTMPLQLTAGEAASRLQTLAKSYENLRVTYVYVLSGGVLKGVLPMRELLFHSRETPIEEFMVKSVVTIQDSASKKEVAELFRQRNLMALPVVNAEGKLVGLITADDVMDVIQELANDEMLKLTGVSADDTRDAPFLKIFRQRFSWLSLNILLDLMAASVIPMFQDTLTAAISLAFFLPIISDMSGCSGMQSVAVSVRDLALNRILPADFLRVLRKELAIGFVNGAALGLVLGIIGTLMKGMPMLGVVVMLALWGNTILAVSVGGILPLLLKQMKFDPAIASGPILTTVTDMAGFFLLLSLGTHWLSYLKH